MVQFLDDYSFLDRMVHRFAFGGRAVQELACDIEAALYGRVYSKAKVTAPIFITGLPRSGTTALLTALQTLPQAASHTYRDMPFVLSPLLWSRLSRPFRKQAGAKERAHGDGLMVGYDSPEAFEEVLWLRSWGSKYQGQKIALWSSKDDISAFQSVLETHIRKVITARLGAECSSGRYISKNNANISRISFLKTVSPDAKIVVPIRHPFRHVQSLLNQHRRFIALHEQQPFVLRYMRDIGHFEFGALHKPIAFPGFAPDAFDLDSPDYWLAYWIAAYSYLTSKGADLVPLSYEHLCSDGAPAWEALCERVGVDLGDHLPRLTAFFRHRGSTSASEPDCDSTMKRRALDVYRSFLE